MHSPRYLKNSSLDRVRDLIDASRFDLLLQSSRKENGLAVGMVLVVKAAEHFLIDLVSDLNG